MAAVARRLACAPGCQPVKIQQVGGPKTNSHWKILNVAQQHRKSMRALSGGEGAAMALPSVSCCVASGAKASGQAI